MKNLNLNSIHNKEQINRKLTYGNLTLGKLETYLKLKFKDYKEAWRYASISEGRVRQILIGYRLPKSSKLINQIAKGWNIDAVKLAILFENNRKGEENGHN